MWTMTGWQAPHKPVESAERSGWRGGVFVYTNAWHRLTLVTIFVSLRNSHDNMPAMPRDRRFERIEAGYMGSVTSVWRFFHFLFCCQHVLLLISKHLGLKKKKHGECADCSKFGWVKNGRAHVIRVVQDGGSTVVTSSKPNRADCWNRL